MLAPLLIVVGGFSVSNIGKPQLNSPTDFKSQMRAEIFGRDWGADLGAGCTSSLLGGLRSKID
jgi:hypothetical protein